MTLNLKQGLQLKQSGQACHFVLLRVKTTGSQLNGSRNQNVF